MSGLTPEAEQRLRVWVVDNPARLTPGYVGMKADLRALLAALTAERELARKAEREIAKWQAMSFSVGEVATNLLILAAQQLP